MRRTESTGGRHAAARPRRPKRHRGQWAAIVLGLAVPALVVPYLLLTRDDSEPVRVDAADYYQFVSMRDGTALDVAGADGADGVRIQQEKRADGAASQQWQLKPMTGGFCQLVNRNSGKVLGIRKSAAAPADVEQQSDTGADTQQWQLTDVGGGAVKIVSRDGGLVLSVTDGTDRHAVVEPADRGSADQRWNLAKVATFAKPPAPVVAAVVAQRSTGTSSAPAAPSGDYAWRNVRIAGGGGLLHSTDGGASLRRLGSVRGAESVGFGKAAPGARYPALYLAGTVNGGTGIFRSTDGGAAWQRINDDQHQYGGGSSVVTGDPDVFGRVYPGSGAARGVLYGEPS